MEQGGKMRLTMVTLGTTVASLAVIGNAFYQKKQFYPSVVFLTKSNPSVAVLYAQAFVLVFLFGKAMRKIFFGQLRASEVEHLIEKFWYVITETCLAFTVFRDDFSAKFVALFTFLLFMKAFHWLIEDRVDYMERSPIIRFIFHIRVISLLIVLGTIDSILIHHAFKTTVASGASVQMVFGFEYAILLTMVVATLMKYSIHVADSVIEHQWDNRNVFLLYGDLITGFVKCCLYLVFVVVMVKIHTFPLFAIRPMYLTIRAFKKSLSDVILSRRAIAYMNTRFQNVELEELERLDVTTCIICRERMVLGKKLPCNHIFHTHCLRSWFQRQQTCPTCRMDILSDRRPNGIPQQQQQQQNAVPQQQQQQQQPPQPPQGFMNMPPFGMFPPHPPPPPPPGHPATPTGTSASPTAAQAATTASAQPNFAAYPPSFSAFTFPPANPSMIHPMFAPQMGMPPFAPPPLLSSLDTSALSVEQLLEMEGQERENVEARIRVLRNVHSLLDAVILQLNQYSNVINTLNAMDQTATQPQNPASTTAQTSSDDGVKASPPSSSSKQDNENSKDEAVDDVDFARLSGAFSDEAIASASGLVSEENELRQRRLERFGSTEKSKDENNGDEDV